jgi:hypothetical protein
MASRRKRTGLPTRAPGLHHPRLASDRRRMFPRALAATLPEDLRGTASPSEQS